MRERREWADEQVLEILHLRDSEGLTMGKIAKLLGVSRSTIIGICYRVEQDTNLVDVSPHLNGSMPARWWQRAAA